MRCIVAAFEDVHLAAVEAMHGIAMVSGDDVHQHQARVRVQDVGWAGRRHWRRTGCRLRMLMRARRMQARAGGGAAVVSATAGVGGGDVVVGSAVDSEPRRRGRGCQCGGCFFGRLNAESGIDFGGVHDARAGAEEVVLGEGDVVDAGDDGEVRAGPHVGVPGLGHAGVGDRSQGAGVGLVADDDRAVLHHHAAGNEVLVEGDRDRRRWSAAGCRPSRGQWQSRRGRRKSWPPSCDLSAAQRCSGIYLSVPGKRKTAMESLLPDSQRCQRIRPCNASDRTTVRMGPNSPRVVRPEAASGAVRLCFWLPGFLRRPDSGPWR